VAGSEQATIREWGHACESPCITRTFPMKYWHTAAHGELSSIRLSIWGRRFCSPLPAASRFGEFQGSVLCSQSNGHVIAQMHFSIPPETILTDIPFDPTSRSRIMIQPASRHHMLGNFPCHAILNSDNDSACLGNNVIDFGDGDKLLIW
jgi:hypothetical protein